MPEPVGLHSPAPIKPPYYDPYGRVRPIQDTSFNVKEVASDGVNRTF